MKAKTAPEEPVTVREVAREANVSVGTVSRVLNGHASVTRDVHERVLRAVQTLDYRPLRKRGGDPARRHALEGKTVGLVLLGMHRSLVNLPVVGAAIHGVEAALSAAGANLLLLDLPRGEALPPAFTASRAEGLLVKSALSGDPLGGASAELREQLAQTPCVWFLGRPPGGGGDVADTDDATVGRLAAEHLTAQGHRALAFLDPRADHVAFQAREASFRYWAERRGARVLSLRTETPAQLPLSRVEDPATLGALIDRLLGQRERATAVFIPADNLAALAYRAFGERGVRVGRDISVIACNNEEPVLMGLHPALTTIDVHAEEIGRRAVDLLVWRLAHREGPPMRLTVEPRLVPGASVATVRQERGSSRAASNPSR